MAMLKHKILHRGSKYKKGDKKQNKNRVWYINSSIPLL